MKFLPQKQPARLRAGVQRQRGLTLVEMMVTMAIFGVAIMGLVYAHIYSLRQDELTNSKLGASDQSRRAFNKLTSEIRSAKIWQIGEGSASTFTPIENGEQQQGNAIQIHPTTDTNTFIRYFFDTDNGQLCRVENGNASPDVIANYLTNTMYFRAEDYAGQIKTELSYKYVIHVMMEFAQYQYPLTRVGPDYYYDYYKMELKVTPHCPDGA